MNQNDMIQMKNAITMPPELADTLLHNCGAAQVRRFPYTQYSRLAMALIAAFAILLTGSTSYAAYNIYQEKQLAVFMDADLSQKDIDRIGQEIAGICEISDCQSVSLQYVSGDEAWEEFKAAYFTDENGEEMTELTEGFGENPLADSFNYQVSVRMSADTQAVRDRISRLPGVRKVTTVREAKSESAASNN